MKPIRITLENFMSHITTDIDCNLFESTLIVGRNKNNSRESNGVGKTTIFHGIDYVLFGKYPTRTVDKIVRDGCDSCKVTFEFEVFSGVYRVVRSRYKKSGKSDLRLYKKSNDDWLDISQKTPTETENELSNKIIKINYKTFHNSVLFAQSDLGGLASATPEARKVILKDVLNLNDYIKFEKIAKKKVAKLTDQLSCTESLIVNMGEPDVDIKENQQKLKDIKINIKAITTKKNKAQDELSKYRQDLYNLKELSGSNLSDLNEKLVELNKRYTKAEGNLTSFQVSLKQKNEKSAKISKELNIKIQEFNTLNEEYKALAVRSVRDVEQVKVELSKCTNNEINGKAYISSFEARVQELRVPMPDEDMCPHCRQPLTEEHKLNCLKKISEEIEELDKKIFENKKKLTVVSTKKVRLQSEIEEIDIIKNQKFTLENKVSTYKEDIGHVQSYAKQLSELIDHIKTDIVSSKENLEDIANKKDDIKTKIDNSKRKDIDQKFNELKLDISEKENELNNILEEMSSLNTYVGIFTEKIDARKKDKEELKKLKRKQTASEKELKLHQHACTAFSSKGIPTMIIYTILDDLQVETNTLLSQLRPGLELQFVVTKDNASGNEEDTLDILYRVHNIERDYEQLSGGQKLFISLSLKLALSLIIQRRLGVDIRFLELDEVDQSLDKAGVDAFADVIKSWQKNFKIFVITHNDALKDKFSNAILVEHDDYNGSKARLVSSW